jgi:hypothetical protein
VFLVTLDVSPLDYNIVVSTRFVAANLTAVATLQYARATARATGPLPPPPGRSSTVPQPGARSFRGNLTASTARPNLQGSFHYNTIPMSRTLVLASSWSATMLAGWRRCAVNGVSFVSSECIQARQRLVN